MIYKGQELEEYDDTYARFKGKGSRTKDLTGNVIGKWVVICRAPGGIKGKSYFWCECKCGAIKRVSSAMLLCHESKGCVKCTRQRMFEGRVRKVGEIPISFWKRFKNKAAGKNSTKKRLNLEFSITIEQAWNLFLKQNRTCALSGLPLAFCTESVIGKEGYKANWKHTASLDRIDNGKGYIIENVQWVHKDINYMKQDYEQEYFISICKKIAMHKEVV
jgi:hypothetical protein